MPNCPWVIDSSFLILGLNIPKKKLCPKLEKNVNIKPNIPGPPGSVNVLSVSYSLPPNAILSVNWDKSSEGDFVSHN